LSSLFRMRMVRAEEIDSEDGEEAGVARLLGEYPREVGEAPGPSAVLAAPTPSAERRRRRRPDDAAAAASSPAPAALSETALLDAVFARLLAAAKEEHAAVARERLRDSRAKRNRRETYLVAQTRSKWRTRSRRFLQRRRDLLSTLPPAARYGAIFLQHLLEVDASDALLPEHSRRFEDSFTESVSDQFLLDATRGRYEVEGEVFHFAESAADEPESAFLERLLMALRRLVPAALLPCVSMAMSQSGLAALERASLCAAAVSGGRQDVSYALCEDPEQPGGLLVTMQVHRHGFREYVVDSMAVLVDDDDDDDGPRPCDSATSSVRKAATLCYAAAGVVDVVAFEVVEIRHRGQLVPMESLCKPILPEASLHRLATTDAKDEEEGMSEGLLGRPLRCVLRCLRRRCPRRGRDGKAAPSTWGPGTPGEGVEDTA